MSGVITGQLLTKHSFTELYIRDGCALLQYSVIDPFAMR